MWPQIEDQHLGLLAMIELRDLGVSDL